MRVSLIVVLLMLFLVGCAGQAVQKGDFVLVRYTGSYTNGTVFDSNDPAYQAQLGLPAERLSALPVKVGAGDVIKGFDEALAGMRPGQTKTVTVKARDAYGPYEAERVVSVPKTLPYDRELHVQRTVIEPNSELRKSVPAIEVGRTFSTRNFAYTITATNGTHTTLYLLDASENANFDLPFNSTLAVTTPDLFVYVHDVRDGATYRTQWGPYTAQANATHVALMTPYRVGESYRLVQGTAKAIRESPSTVTLDFNHPLAGHDLMFTITIDSIQAVT